MATKEVIMVDPSKVVVVRDYARTTHPLRCRVLLSWQVIIDVLLSVSLLLQLL